MRASPRKDLKLYLNSTKRFHNGQGYESIIGRFNADGTLDYGVVSELARACDVTRSTIYFWHKIWLENLKKEQASA